MKLKTLADYYEPLQEQFPELSRADIVSITNYGWKRLFGVIDHDCDVVINDKYFWCYIGKLGRSHLRHYLYYINKLISKIRYLFFRTDYKWDGYYYFALSNADADYLANKLLSQGRPKNKYTFKNVMLYKLLDECKISQRGARHIFRTFIGVNLGFKFFRRNAIIRKPELVLSREPVRFKDLVTSYNLYDVLNGKRN